MAFDMFLKLGTIQGESADSKHSGEIEVLSYSWGVESDATGGTGGGGSSGQPRIGEVHIVSTTSKATPPIVLAVATGQHQVEATLTVRKPGSDPIEFLKYVMGDVLVTSYHTGTSAADALSQDEFTLHFQKLALTYVPQKADGSADAPVVANIAQL